MSLLEVHDLRVRRGGVPALRGVSFEVDRREVVALLGANGAGKTTTLRAISDLSTPESGEIRFDGRSIVGASSTRVVEAGIAHVPEGSRI